MARGGFHQTAVIPLALFCGVCLLYPAWYHHTLLVTGPVFATRAEVDRWAAQTAHDRKCIAMSIDYVAHGEGDERVTGDAGPWFGTLKCNQPRIYPRLAAIFLGPYLVISLIARMLFPPDKKPKKA